MRSELSGDKSAKMQCRAVFITFTGAELKSLRQRKQFCSPGLCLSLGKRYILQALRSMIIGSSSPRSEGGRAPIAWSTTPTLRARLPHFLSRIRAKIFKKGFSKP